MKDNEYKEYYGLVSELKNLYDELKQYNYRGCDIKFCDYPKSVVGVLKERKSAAQAELKRINRIKESYNAPNDSDKRLLIFDSKSYNSYLVYSEKCDSPIKVYNYKEEELVEYENFSTFVSLLPDNESFILASKIEKANEEDCYECHVFLGWSCGRELISDVKSWEYISETIIVFHLVKNKGVAIYDKNNNKIIFSDVDSISSLKEDFGNYKSNETYLIQKELHLDDNDILIGFFMNKDGRIVSDIFDINGRYYQIEDRNNKSKYTTNLQKVYNDIITLYKDKSINSKIENVLVKKNIMI